MDVNIVVGDEDGLGLTGTVPISLTANPIANLVRLDILIDNVVKKSGPYTSPFTYNWNTTQVADGTHIIKANAVYKKRTSSAQVAVTVANNVTPPPPPPSPPPVGTPIFDGRAINMRSITCSTLRVGQPGWAGGSNASQDPIIWGDPPFTSAKQGVYGMIRNGVGDISLQADSTYGKVYVFSVGQGSTNPYLDVNADGRASGELTIARPITPGQWDWYAEAVKIATPWHMPPNSPFCVMLQFGYPTILFTPLSLCLDNNGLGIDRHVGAADLTKRTIQYAIKPRFYKLADVADKWLELVIGVKWEFDKPGEIYVYGRLEGDTDFTLKYSDTTHPTNQYELGKSFKTKVNDKMGLYLGRFPVGSINNNVVVHRGFVRYNNQTDAINSMG